VRASQEVGGDHLETVTAGFVRAQHPGCGFDCLLDDRDLALVNLEKISSDGSSSFPPVPSPPPA
jgi:hypothetical protein